MAGHSHSKNIKIRKGAVDAKKSRLFSKLSRLIIVAARTGGGDVRGNPKLALAVNKAKAVSMPKDNIEKAIKKGTGESADSSAFEEIVYEGYGPNGVAVLCEILTDNRNRTAGEIRKIFDLSGGKLGATNCVAYLFQRKGQFLIDAAGRTEDELMEIALDAGASDLRLSGDYYEVICEPSAFDAVAAAFAKAGIEPAEADLAQIPDAFIKCDDVTAKRIAKLLDALDDHDDVQNVYSNADLPEGAFAET